MAADRAFQDSTPGPFGRFATTPSGWDRFSSLPGVKTPGLVLSSFRDELQWDKDLTHSMLRYTL